MVQICRENGLTVRVRVWLWKDRNITAFHLWLQMLYRPSLCLFSPSGSHILYPPSSWRRTGRRKTLCRCQAHQVHSPSINAITNQKDSFAFQTKCLIQGCNFSGFLDSMVFNSNQILEYLFTHVQIGRFHTKWPLQILSPCLVYATDTSVCPGFAMR